MPRQNKPTKHVPYQPQSTCGTKRRYNDKISAEKSADILMLQDMNLELRVYQCSDCQKWHLTRLNR